MVLRQALYEVRNMHNCIIVKLDNYPFAIVKDMERAEFIGRMIERNNNGSIVSFEPAYLEDLPF